MNFSYWILLNRKNVQNYFNRVYEVLADDGLFFLDCYGGYEAPKEIKEKRKLKDFTYIWHQADFDPLSSEMKCHIHFKFPDKSQMKKADRLGAQNVLIVGDDEAAAKKAVLRNMNTREQIDINFENLVTTLKDILQK